jgi:hypothetical protein
MHCCENHALLAFALKSHWHFDHKGDPHEHNQLSAPLACLFDLLDAGSIGHGAALQSTAFISSHTDRIRQ